MYLKGINHIVLKVGSLELADGFYRGVLGLEKVGERKGVWFYSAGGHAHDLALAEVGRAPRPHPHSTGLFHFCINARDEVALAALHRRCREAGGRVSVLMDQGALKSFYAVDPDGHIVEVGLDVPGEALEKMDNPFRFDQPYAFPGGDN